LTHHGKLDRRALPAPDQYALGTQAYAAPTGEIEELLADIWRELLQIRRVGRNDNFFDLGGNSLLAMQLSSRVRVCLSLDLSMRVLFANPTLRELAEQIGQLRRASQPDETLIDEEDIDRLLEQVTLLPDTQVQELLRKMKMEGRP
jgi:aryl carrier-like protein